MALTVSPTDPLLVALKVALLHALPDLTGRQINDASLTACVTIKRYLQDDGEFTPPTPRA